MDKTHILSEIKRTAKANGGTPLGIRAFQKETGIRNADWLGKYWVRWSEALHEAGYAPNAMVGAYDEAVLLEKYAGLIREIKCLPVRGNMLMKTRRDSTFPNEATFINRFGSKRQIISKVEEYCKGQGGYEDVLAICLAYTSKPSDAKESAESNAGADEIGFVYLIKSGKRYKVGKSAALERRERELAMQLAEKPSTIHTIRTDDPSGIESYWHRRFAQKRKYGEWFELSSADVKAFKLRKFM